MLRILLITLLTLAYNLNVLSQTPRVVLNNGKEIFFTSQYMAVGTYNSIRSTYLIDFEDLAVTKFILQKDRVYTQFDGGCITMSWLVFDYKREFSCIQCWRLEDNTSICYNYCEDSLMWYFEFDEELNMWTRVMLFTKLDTLVRESD